MKLNYKKYAFDLYVDMLYRLNFIIFSKNSIDEVLII